jgi:phage regulator Rha-like protein
MMDIQIRTDHNEARADSRQIAEALGNAHKNVISLLDDYREDFAALGILAFETEEIRGRGQPAKYALLTEDQCYFLLTLVRNSDQVVPLKRGLVQAFRTARERSSAPTLPSDPLDLLALSLQSLQHQRSQIQVIERRLDTAPIRINSEARARVYAVHPRRYSGAYRAFKEAFGFAGAPLAAYDDLPQNRLDEALSWLELQTRTFQAQRPLLESS